MKKLLLLTLMSALAAVSMAQTAGPAGGAPQTPATAKGAKLDRKELAKINEEILAKLNLSDDQKTKLKTHQTEMEAKLKELRKGAKGGDKAALKEKVKAIREENQKFLKQTLTKDQMRQMQKLRREKMKELREKSGTPTTP